MRKYNHDDTEESYVYRYNENGDLLSKTKYGSDGNVERSRSHRWISGLGEKRKFQAS